jgi:hypothetical protein
MRRLFILALVCAPVLAQVPAGSSKINIEVAPGSTLTDNVRPSNTTRNVTITRNPQDTVTATFPTHMHSGLNVDDTNAVIPGPGYDVDRVRDTTDAPVAGGGGQFRLECVVGWRARNDPIVYPGQPGRSHDHMGWGNTALDAFSTVETLLATGNSSCRGGTINKSAYWVPTLIDLQTSKPILPASIKVYYKNAGYPKASIEDLPIGLRMIAGDPMATKPQPNNSSQAHTWKCGTKFYQGIPTDQLLCPPGSSLVVSVYFPQCWDGSNLDSPDHKSHMSYGSSVKVPLSNPAVYQRVCPATHPKVIPQISFQLNYVVTDSRQMRFVSDTNLAQQAGWTMHGDVIVAWKKEVMERWVRNCNRAGAECHSHILGPDANGKLEMIY